MAVTSAGSALGQRTALEEDYTHVLAPEVEDFMTEVQKAALAAAISAVVVMSLWASLLDRLSSKGMSATLVDSLRSSELPLAALGAARAAQAYSVQAGLTPSQSRHYLATMLGLAHEPFPGVDGAYGRILGSTETPPVSWVGDTQAAARTAATADFNYSMLEEMRAEGYTHKRWQTRYDLKVRPTHVEADRQTILLDDNFMVGSASLRFPGDPLASSLGEVINCRCVLVAVRFSDRPDAERGPSVILPGEFPSQIDPE